MTPCSSCTVTYRRWSWRHFKFIYIDRKVRMQGFDVTYLSNGHKADDSLGVMELMSNHLNKLLLEEIERRKL